MTLPLIIAPNDPGHIDDHQEIHTLLGRLDGQSTFLAAGSATGALGSRPAASASNLGDFYFAASVPSLAFSDGAVWREQVLTSAANTFTAINTFDDDTFMGSGRPWADVYAHNAVGDNVANDTAAFNAAKAELGTASGIIYAPPGTFKVDTFSLDVVGLQLIGAGRTTTTIRINGTDEGIRILRQDCVLADMTVQPFSGALPDELVTLEASAGNAVQRCHLRNLEILGNNIAGLTGLFMAGVEGVAGCYNNYVEHVVINQCPSGIVTYTVTVGTHNPISNISNQRNAMNVFVNVVVANATTAVQGNTALDHQFFGCDIESNTTGVDVNYIHAWTFTGCYLANTTNWSTGSNALGEIVAIGTTGCTGTDFIDSGHTLVGAPGGKGDSYFASLKESKHADNPLTWGRALVIGDDERCYWKFATSTSVGSGSTTMATATPQLSEITDGKANVYHLKAMVVGQEDTNGDTASYEVHATFKAARAGAVITVSQIGSTTVVHAGESNAAWTAGANIDGGATTFRVTASGTAGDGTIRWRCWVQILELRGQ